MTMRIKIGDLRRIIRDCLVEAGGGVANRRRPVTADPSAPAGVGREQLTKISAKDLDDPDELAPHLRDDTPTIYDPYDTPVPPVAPKPRASPDPLVKDYSVLPTPPIKR